MAREWPARQTALADAAVYSAGGLLRGSPIIPAALPRFRIEFGLDAELAWKINGIGFSTASRKLIEELKGK
jgi:hypothetical protein